MAINFQINIILGNAAMQTGEDVAAALEGVAARLRDTSLEPGVSATIRDVNGGTVGVWFTEEKP